MGAKRDHIDTLKMIAKKTNPPYNPNNVINQEIKRN